MSTKNAPNRQSHKAATLAGPYCIDPETGVSAETSDRLLRIAEQAWGDSPTRLYLDEEGGGYGVQVLDGARIVYTSTGHATPTAAARAALLYALRGGTGRGGRRAGGTNS